MKRKPVDVTGLFDDYAPKIYNSSKEFLESQSTERLIELLYLIKDFNNYNHDDLIYIAELNHQFNRRETQLECLDRWQMNGLTQEIKDVILQDILNQYEESLEAQSKVIELF